MTESRELPHNFEAEQALLGAILMNNAAFHHCSEIVESSHFSDPLHGRLFDALARLIERGQIANLLALKAYFGNDADLATAGGPPYLARLIGASVNAYDAAGCARLIRDGSLRRRLIRVANEALTAAYEPSPERSAADDIEALERGLFALASTGHDSGFAPFGRSLAGALKAAEAAHKRDGQWAGLATGLPAIDRLLGGLHPSDLVVLAGRPSMGKTALATNIAFHAARTYRAEQDAEGRPRTVDGAVVGFFSLEMSAEQLANRILAEQAGVPSERIRRGELRPDEFDRVLAVAAQLERTPLHIDDTPALTIAGLRTRARRLKRTHDLGLVVVDYLQLVDAQHRKDGRVQEVSEITRGLKTLAKELDVPVLALSQLSRAVEQRTDKRPQLSDLRDSGTIEQDADVVMFVYRDEYYLERNSGADQAARNAAAGKAELLVAKQRHGPTGIAHLLFDGATTKFSDNPNEGERQAA
jgi:replicative DNA helicase